MSGRTGNDSQYRSPLKTNVLIHIAALITSLVLVFLLTSLLLKQAWFNQFLTSNGWNETVLAAIVVGAVCLNSSLICFALRTFRRAREVDRAVNRNKPKPVQRGLVVHTDNLDSSERARALRLVKLKRTAERLNSIEKDLIRKLGNHYHTDRETDELLCELQICTTRLLAQVAEMRNVSHRRLEHADVP